jgi:hypothetical protein
MGLHVCTYQNINSREAASECPAGFRIGVGGLAGIGIQAWLRFPDSSLYRSRLLSMDRLIHHKFDVMAGTWRQWRFALHFPN